MKSLLRCAGVLVLLAAVAVAQVGSPLPKPDLTGFTQTDAKRWEDYSGRLVLLEFFAYW